MKKIILALFLFAFNSHAAITFNDVTPDPTTSGPSDTLNIRDFMTISGGSTLENGNANIGNYGNSMPDSAKVTVTGAGSVWSLQSNLQVGSPVGQAADLYVLDGGALNVEFPEGAGENYIQQGSGYSCGSGCVIRLPTTVEVSGNNSRLTTEGGIFIDANMENGTFIDVKDGGAIESGDVQLWLYGSNHPRSLNIEVSGGDSLWTVNGSLSSNETGASITVGTAGEISASVIGLVNSDVLLSGGTITAESFVIVGDNNNSPLFVGEGSLSGYGVLKSRVTLTDRTPITASGGTLTLGDAELSDSFSTDGDVYVDAGSTLSLQSRGNFSVLGRVNSIDGGAITSNNGVFLDGGQTLRGHGGVSTRLSAAVGSFTEATGDLSLGSATALDGFFSDGLLHVNNNTVTLNDANRAVVGSLTEIGNATGPGTLSAPNGILVEFGKNISGYGAVVGDILNNGFIQGVGPSGTDFLDLQGLVTGVGDYGGTIAFSGGFSPGLSPTETEVENVIFTSTLDIEIGGLIAGDEFDKITASGFAILGGTLQVTLIDSFVPEAGDMFVFLTAVGGVTGDFTGFDFPTFDGLTFDLFVGDDFAKLTAVNAVPIPPAVFLFGSGIAALMFRRRVS